MYAPDSASPPVAPPPGGDAQRNARYVFLVTRLRNRQMTMEEATELFAVMQAMLRASEAARLALSRSPMAAPTLPAETRPAPLVLSAPAAGGADEFLLMGLLAMGAGAGLMAAMAKRMQDFGPVAPAGSPAPPTRRAGPSPPPS